MYFNEACLTAEEDQPYLDDLIGCFLGKFIELIDALQPPNITLPTPRRQQSNHLDDLVSAIGTNRHR